MSPPPTPLVGKCKPTEPLGQVSSIELEMELNRSSGCRVTASARIGVPDRNAQMGQPWPLHIYGPRWFQRTWGGANPSTSGGATASTRIWVSCRNAQMVPTGKRCQSWGQDDAIELDQQLQSHSVCKHLGAWWECHQGPHRPMTMLLHIYRPRQFHRTWDRMKWSNHCGVTASTRNWAPDGYALTGSRGQWPCPCTSTG